MAYDRQGNWVAEDVQSPYTQRNVQQPGNAGWMVGNNGQTAGINSEGRMSDYDRMALDNGVSSANAESAIAESQYGLNTNRKVERDNDITGSAMRINKGADPAIYGTGGLKGKQIVNTYDPDRPASMGAQGNNPWQDMARQLATFSELRNRPSEQGGVAIMADPADHWNGVMDQMRRSGAQSMPAGLSNRQQANFIQKQNEMNMQAQTATRGQDLSFAGQIAGQGVQTRGQDMQYRSHMEGLGLQGRNQRDLADLQGHNQLANAELAYGMQGQNQAAHDMRAGQSARDLEELKQRVQMNDPKNAAQAKLYESQAKLYGTQSEVAQRSLDFDKSADGSIQKWMKLYADMGLPHEQALQESIKRHLGSKRAYAEGGQVESPEQVMARIQAKYGVSGNAPQPQAQAPAPQPVRQQAPAPQQPTGGLMDRLRNVATGGLDRRMQAAGFAEGGEIQALKAKIAGFEKAGQDYTAKWNSQNVSGIGGSGGYGSFTNSNGTSFGEGSTKSIGSAIAGNNWSNAGNGAVPSWQQPVDQGYGAAVRPDSNQGYGIGGGLSLARSNNAAATDSLIKYANDPYALQVYAEGGPIAVGGRPVVGAGDGKSDSLPAVIDGEHPAALSTGEFVMPIEAVRHFGLDKLNKMVAAARKGLDTGRDSA